MQEYENLAEWTAFSGPFGLDGEFGQPARDPALWVTRMPSGHGENRYVYTVYDTAAWRAFSAAFTRADSKEPTHV